MKNARMILVGLATIAALLVSAVAHAPIAAAHTCSSNNHGGCDGHSCPETKVHAHRTGHWYGDHWCQSDPAVGAIYGPTNSLSAADLEIQPIALE